LDDTDMTVELDTSELDALTEALKTAAVQIVPNTESKVLTEVARTVRTDAAAAAPRDTGDLANSVFIRGGQGYRTIGTTLKQGFFQEHGTSRHPPQPWLTPAADRGVEQIERLLGEVADPLP
jgi:hypothetical protein